MKLQRPTPSAYCFLIHVFMWLFVDFLWLSVDSLGAAASWGKVIYSKYAIWRLIKAAEIGLCTQLFKMCQCRRWGGRRLLSCYTCYQSLLSAETQDAHFYPKHCFSVWGYKQFPWTMGHVVAPEGKAQTLRWRQTALFLLLGPCVRIRVTGMQLAERCSLEVH